MTREKKLNALCPAFKVGERSLGGAEVREYFRKLNSVTLLQVIFGIMAFITNCSFSHLRSVKLLSGSASAGCDVAQKYRKSGCFARGNQWCHGEVWRGKMGWGISHGTKKDFAPVVANCSGRIYPWLLTAPPQ